MYSQTVMDHFTSPRNVGVIEDADGVGEVGNPVCGDMMTFYIKVKGGRLSDVKFNTFGCVAAIAVSSMVTEMAVGKTLEEAKALSKSEVARALGGLPKEKMHCSNLGADALSLAIEDYEHRAFGKPKREAPAEEDHEKCAACCCCGARNPDSAAFCMSCGGKIAADQEVH